MRSEPDRPTFPPSVATRPRRNRTRQNPSPHNSPHPGSDPTNAPHHLARGFLPPSCSAKPPADNHLAAIPQSATIHSWRPERRWTRDELFIESDDETTKVLPGTGIRKIPRPPSGNTETVRPGKQRRGQDYFREIVLNNYANRCVITGLPVRELLIALNRLHDAAFDQGLIDFDDELRLILSPKLKSSLLQPAIAQHFESYEHKPLTLSHDSIPPNPEFLSKHRARFKLPA